MFAILANPLRFMGATTRLAPACALAAAPLAMLGLYLALLASPPEADQGDTARIMYVHVPSAWLAMAGYAALGVSSLVYLVWRHVLADVAAKAIAPLGAAFAFLTLVTGAIWGRPTWGFWWVWDARLSSMLVLFLLFVGYVAVRAGLDDERKSAQAGAILALVGMANLPIVKFSVDWWSTAHQPASVIRLDGPTLHGDFLWPLLVMALAFTLAFASLVVTRMRTEIWNRRADALERAAEARELA